MPPAARMPQLPGRGDMRAGWVRRTLLITAAGLIALLSLGFLLLPAVARRLAERELEDLLGRRVEIARVYASPLALTLTAHDLTVFEADGRTACAGVARLELDGSWRALYRHDPVFREVVLQSPWMRLVRLDGDPDHRGRFNVSDILARFHAHPSRPPPLSVRVIQLRDTRITVEDRTASVERRGRIDLSGRLQVGPLRADLSLRLREVPATIAQPALAHSLSLLLTGGLLSGEGRLRIQPRASFRGDLQLEGLTTVDAVRGEPLVAWRSLRLAGLSLGSGPAALSIDSVTLVEPTVRLLLFPDGRLNVQGLIPRSGQGPSAPATIGIGQISVRSGRLRFTDQRLQPEFRAELDHLNGTVTGLASHSSGVRVDLSAAIGGSGRVAASGTIAPVHPGPAVDLTVDASQIELPPLSPYAIRHTGHPIRTGNLALSAAYRVVSGRLSGRNHLRIEQLSLGEKVDGPATRLPLPLAVALLTDRHGVIDVELPVGGSVDDPQFQVLPAALQALRRLIERAVTAPFSLVASAVSGGERLGRLEFPAGHATLDRPAQQNISALAQLLRERPRLALELDGQADPRRDRSGLRRPDVDSVRALAHHRAIAVRDALVRLVPDSADRVSVSRRTLAGTGVQIRLKAR